MEATAQGVPVGNSSSEFTPASPAAFSTSSRTLTPDSLRSIQT
ncbi:uncharacterized protein CLUP02_03616 [Colletotrichum lupini]|uniref:Uncharacterized protein n=1 Tax=Colletotrichum lupini TaxID=145971 RepID=A0A9Q8WCX0_9PEZI|nr:uncharacterized protein CLUP02_03616 [Colletotrichum lupini]UQC78142.1 hypothetical protein CLUP02_03616 [Colletotrichum lupini]